MNVNECMYESEKNIAVPNELTCLTPPPLSLSPSLTERWYQRAPRPDHKHPGGERRPAAARLHVGHHARRRDRLLHTENRRRGEYRTHDLWKCDGRPLKMVRCGMLSM